MTPTPYRTPAHPESDEKPRQSPVRSHPDTTRHVPEIPALRREWLSLHRRHLRALRGMERVGKKSRDWGEFAYAARKLADAKYGVWLRDLRERIRWMTEESDSEAIQ